MAAASTARTSLVEQKRLQWAKEREEMSRLIGTYDPLKNNSTRTSIRTYANGARGSLGEINGKQHSRYASTMSLRSLASLDAAGLRGQDYTSASLIDLQEQLELERAQRRQRSPSLPPIFNKDEYRYQESEAHKLQQSRSSGHRCSRNRGRRPCCCEEREGETTSGYASDNLDVPGQQQVQQVQQQVVVLPCHVNGNNPDAAMGERTWQNSYYTDENSLPPTSRNNRLASIRGGNEFNRQRWGSVWGQEITSKDPPPPSWLERGLSRLDHNSQVLVINHDSASSPDSSTTGSLGSESNKTYLRGQNRPIDADILQEREIRRQKALEHQTAIKQQLEERDRKRKEERDKKLREERDEEERIRRERDLEKLRFEEEHQRQLEKEAAKLKKSKAMQEVLEAAERQAKEEKRQRRRRNEDDGETRKPENSGGEPQRPSVDKETKQAINRAASNMDTQ